MAKTAKRRTRRTRKNVIGPLKKGELKVCGYSTKKTAKQRHNALKCAVRKYGKLSTFRKLNAIAVLNKNRRPTLSRKMKADRNWVRRTYMK